MVNFNTKELKVKIYSDRDDGTLPSNSVDAICGALEWAFTHSGNHRLVLSYGNHSLGDAGETAIKAIINDQGGKAHCRGWRTAIFKPDGGVISTFEVSSGTGIADRPRPPHRPPYRPVNTAADEQWFVTKTAKKSNKTVTRRTRNNRKAAKKAESDDEDEAIRGLRKLRFKDDSDNDSTGSAFQDAKDQGLTQELF
ncbi:hypothetical protein SEMRO_468_G149030.1 [Seminavis robusta]|uniref:Uncharacterized protein n=1 Tax=Seminavis robusta TaxID=568900 RepID=A0A9N8E1N7_9STRA|nr:hypothetical protein SEMRO_468_G149030.1 [Seminavis robusta]|eukprot:Sro468_g149030.1 n/a (196) ;mRNA; f:2824-3411